MKKIRINAWGYASAGRLAQRNAAQPKVNAVQLKKKAVQPEPKAMQPEAMSLIQHTYITCLSLIPDRIAYE